MSSSRRALLMLLLPLLCAEGGTLVRKCCARGQVLNASEYECVKGGPDSTGLTGVGNVRGDSLDWLDPNTRIEADRQLKQLFSGLPPEIAIEYGNGFICRNPILVKTSDPEYVLLENGVLKWQNVSFPPQSFCTDRVIHEDGAESFVYLFCSFKKCCASNEVFGILPLDCVDQKQKLPWRMNFYDEDLHLLNMIEVVPFLISDSDVTKTFCDLNTSYQRFIIETRNTFYLQRNGSVFIGDPVSETFKSGEFCVDRTFAQGQLYSAVIICRPKPQKLTGWYISCGIVNFAVCLSIVLLPFLIPKLLTRTMKLVICRMICDVFYYVIRIITFAWANFPKEMCQTYGLMTQYFRLAAFFWINVMCIDMTLKFSAQLHAPAPMWGRPKLCTRRFVCYSLHAWGSPAAIFVLTAVLDLAPGLPEHHLRPYIDDYSCWFHSTITAFLYYYGPVSLLLIINVVLFLITSISIYRTRKEIIDVLGKDTILRAHREDQRSVVLYLKIILLMGLTYVTEMIALGGDALLTGTLIDVNSLVQSLFVFKLFCWKPQVLGERLKELKGRWC